MAITISKEFPENKKVEIISRLKLKEDELYEIGKFEDGSSVMAIWTELGSVFYGFQYRTVPKAYNTISRLKANGGLEAR